MALPMKHVHYIPKFRKRRIRKFPGEALRPRGVQSVDTLGDLDMTRLTLCALLLVAGCAGPAPVAAPTALPEFRTVDQAVAGQIRKGGDSPVGQSGYRGISVVPDPRGRLQILEVAPESAAARAGLLVGDVLVDFGDEEQLRDRIHAAMPGDDLKLAVERRGSSLEVTAKLGAISRPMKLAER